MASSSMRSIGSSSSSGILSHLLDARMCTQGSSRISVFDSTHTEELQLFPTERVFLEKYAGDRSSILALLGLTHLFGIDREINNDRAREIFLFLNKKGALWTEDEMESWYIDQHRIAIRSVPNFSQFVQECEGAACKERFKIYYLLIPSYVQGHGTEVNLPKVAECLEVLRGFKDVGRVNYIFGLLYKSGLQCGEVTIIERDVQKYQQYIANAAALRFAQAICERGILNEQGIGITKNPYSAFSYFRRAAELGDARGLYYMGRQFENGPLVQQNPEEAVHHFKRSAIKGCVEAFLKLSNLYKLGLNRTVSTEPGSSYQIVILNRNTHKSWKYLSRAAWQGNPDACYEMGRHYNQWKAIAGNVNLAALYYVQASNMGHIEANYQVARFYLKGSAGFENKPERAVEHLKFAADMGLSQAQHQLALCYRDGIGGLTVDNSKARDLLNESRDYTKSCLLLSQCHENGELGLSNDHVMSIRYLEIAARDNDSQAHMLLGYLALVTKEGAEKGRFSRGIHSCKLALKLKKKNYGDDLNGKVQEIIALIKSEDHAKDRNSFEVCSLLIMLHQHGYIPSNDPIFTEMVHIHDLDRPNLDGEKPRSVQEYMHASVLLSLLNHYVYGNTDQAVRYALQAHEYANRTKNYNSWLQLDDFREASFILGQHYWQQGDFKEAVAFCNMANNRKDHSRAQGILGDCYLHGKGIPSKNVFLARKHLELPASKGDKRAMLNLALCCEKTKEIEEAVRLFLLLSQEGIAEAQYKAALYHLHGPSIKRNYLPQNRTIAIHLLQNAASSGHLEAIRELAKYSEAHTEPLQQGEEDRSHIQANVGNEPDIDPLAQNAEENRVNSLEELVKRRRMSILSKLVLEE